MGCAKEKFYSRCDTATYLHGGTLKVEQGHTDADLRPFCGYSITLLHCSTAWARRKDEKPVYVDSRRFRDRLYTAFAYVRVLVICRHLTQEKQRFWP